MAQIAVFRDFERSVGRLGVSPGRTGMLILIDANPGLAQSRLAEAIGLDRSTLVPILDQFEAAGLVERRPGADRRSNGLWLTRDGKRRLARVRVKLAEHEARMLAPLAPRERVVLIDLLARIAQIK